MFSLVRTEILYLYLGKRDSYHKYVSPSNVSYFTFITLGGFFLNSNLRQEQLSYGARWAIALTKVLLVVVLKANKILFLTNVHFCAEN